MRSLLMAKQIRQHHEPLNNPMTFFLNDYWWVYLLRGVLAVLLAILALLVPGSLFQH